MERVIKLFLRRTFSRVGIAQRGDTTLIATIEASAGKH